MRVARARYINDNSYLITTTNCFTVTLRDRTSMLQWLDNNAIEFKIIVNYEGKLQFKILSETDQQKQNLMFFELKWIHNES